MTGEPRDQAKAPAGGDRLDSGELRMPKAHSPKTNPEPPQEDVFSRTGTHLREMTEDDIPEVLALEREVFTDPWPERFFRELMAYDYQHALAVVKESGEIVGYAIYSVVFEDMNLDNICIAPEWRNLHLGDALLDAALADGALLGAAMCFLEVRAGNVPAISLYEKKGFVMDRLRREYYQSPAEDAKLYHKELS